jgi:aspartate/methionine/tyrosine aminotransferase
MKFARMLIEAESPEEYGYDRIKVNLAESAVRDRRLADVDVRLDNQLLCYADHHGYEPLRAAIADASGAPLSAQNVLVTAGAASALFYVALTLLEPSDHLIVMRPNYATNIATPTAIRCAVDYLDLQFETGFRVDVDRLRALLKPNTKLISITLPNNPTGVSQGAVALLQIVRLAERHGCRLLVDETYREMAFGAPLPVAATLSDRAISVSSLSKTFGVPGIRIGWIVTSDRRLLHELLCIKEQIAICGSVLDEYVGHAIYAAREEWLPENNRRIGAGLSTVKQWLTAELRMEWVAPDGGCVCFPRIRADAGIDVAQFHRRLIDDHGVFVGPGHWFDQTDDYMRLGFGCPTPNELAQGLAAISSALTDSRR